MLRSRQLRIKKPIPFRDAPKEKEAFKQFRFIEINDYAKCMAVH